MRFDPLWTAILFASGVLLLEASGSVLHTQILHDIPPELGLTLPRMLLRDLLLAALAGLVFFVATRILHRERRSHRIRRARPVLAGVLFALLLEMLNWILPNSLLTPATPVQGLLAWIYFVAGVVLMAARPLGYGWHEAEVPQGHRRA